MHLRRVMPLYRVLTVVCAAACLLVVTTIPSSAAVHTTTAWRDDFNTLNRGTWRVVPWDCNDPANVSVANGVLRLREVASSSTVCPLVGGRVDTYDLRTFAPGTYTARIKFAPRKGSWQTFWLTGASGRPFPANGEVDIAEILGREPNVDHLRLHSVYADGRAGRCTQLADLGRAAGSLSNWHTYSVTTSAGRAVFRIDGAVVASFTPNITCTWPFADPMRVILSAGGGTWAGPPDKSLFPITMLVDWFTYNPA
jgi:beta-glucanase (GH16 family)